MKNSNNRNIFVAVVIGLILVLCICLLFKKTYITEVTVAYTSEYAASKAAEMGYSDSDFIKFSSLTGVETNDVDSMEQSVSEAITSNTGYFVLDSIRKITEDSIQLVLSAKQAAFSVKTGSNYIVIDSKLTILEVAAAPKKDLINVDGITIKQDILGTTASDTDGKIKHALGILDVINQNGYNGIFTGFKMCDQKEVMLYTSSDVPVVINLRYSVDSSLAIAKSMLARGLSNGRIEVVNDYGYFIPDTEDGFVNKGM